MIEVLKKEIVFNLGERKVGVASIPVIWVNLGPLPERLDFGETG